MVLGLWDVWELYEEGSDVFCCFLGGIWFGFVGWFVGGYLFYFWLV